MRCSNTTRGRGAGGCTTLRGEDGRGEDGLGVGAVEVGALDVGALADMGS